MRHEFRVDRNVDETFVEEPIYVFHFLKQDDSYIIVDEEIENPDITHFFFVLKKLNDNGDYLCKLNDKLLICHWTMTNNFHKYSIPLVKRPYPTLLAAQLVSVQPMIDSSIQVYINYSCSETDKSNEASSEDV